MKKLSWSIFFLAGAFAVMAQEQVALTLNKSYRDTDTVATFGVFNGDLNEHRRQLKAHLGQPKSEHIGSMFWENQEIAGIGKNLTIKLSDGLMSLDKYRGDAYRELFKSDEDKTEKLKSVNAKNWRSMQIEITDASGNNLINNPDKETTARNFLLKKMGQ